MSDHDNGAPSGLDGLIAVVTGGSSGIGAEIVRRLHAGGATVAVLDRAPIPDPNAALILQADLADGPSIAASIQTVVGAFGGIDILVNNAGIGAQGTVEDNDDEEWHRIYDVNVVGMVRVTRAVLPHLRTSSAASVVNLSSVVATTGLPDRALYSATKGAVLSLSRAMAADHLPDGIRVNCVAPGTADTPWVARLLESAADPAAQRARLEARQPHGRLVTATEVAEAVAYLAGRNAGSTTGTVLEIDGGLSNLRLAPR